MDSSFASRMENLFMTMQESKYINDVDTSSFWVSLKSRPVKSKLQQSKLEVTIAWITMARSGHDRRGANCCAWGKWKNVILAALMMTWTSIFREAFRIIHRFLIEQNFCDYIRYFDSRYSKNGFKGTLPLWFLFMLYATIGNLDYFFTSHKVQMKIIFLFE